MIEFFILISTHFSMVRSLDQFYSRNDDFRADSQILNLEVNVPEGSIKSGYTEISLKAINADKFSFTIFCALEFVQVGSIKILSDPNSELKHKVEKVTNESKIEISLRAADSVPDAITVVIYWVSTFQPQTSDDSNSFVSMFDSMSIKKWIPHLNSAFYRTKFQLKIKPIFSKRKPSNVKIVANTPLVSENEGGFHVFKMTSQQIVPYQIGFAILDGDSFQEFVTGFYFDIPITFHGSAKDVQSDSTASIVDVVIYALTYCEGNFNIPLDWPKLDFILAGSKARSSHHPGNFFL